MCKCGCNTCNLKAVTLVKHRYTPILSEALINIITNKKTLRENPYPRGSKAYFSLWKEARYLYSRGIINVDAKDAYTLKNTRLGEQVLFENKVVPLDYLIQEFTLSENVQSTKLIYFTIKENKPVKIEYCKSLKKII